MKTFFCFFDDNKNFWIYANKVKKKRKSKGEQFAQSQNWLKNLKNVHLSIAHFRFLNRIYGIKKRRFLFMGEVGVGYGGGFALLVVLFILLVIIGASWGYGGF